MRRSANCVAARARVTPPHLRIGCATLSFFSFTDSVAPCRSRGTFSLRSPNEVVCSTRQSNHRLMISHKCHSSRRILHAVDSSGFLTRTSPYLPRSIHAPLSQIKSRDVFSAATHRIITRLNAGFIVDFESAERRARTRA